MSEPVIAPVVAANPVAEPVAEPTGSPANDNVEVQPREPVKSEPELYELVIDGEKQQLTLEQIKVRAQKAAAVEKRFKEASQKEKQLEAMIKEFESDPEAVMAKLGKDASKIFADHLARKAKQELMTPEQVEKERLDKELADYRAKEQTAKEAQEQVEKEAEDAQTFAALDKQLIGAAQKHQLDQTPETFELMCDIALEAIDMDIPITPDQVAQEVIHRQSEHIRVRDQKLFSKMTFEQKKTHVGEAFIKELLGESLKRVPSASTPKVKAPVEKPPAAPQKYVTEAEFMRNMKKKFG